MIKSIVVTLLSLLAIVLPFMFLLGNPLGFIPVLFGIFGLVYGLGNSLEGFISDVFKES